MLRDNVITKYVTQQNLIENFDPERLRSSAYDFRVGTIFHNGQIKSEPNDWVDIPPGGMFTGFTLEELNLPDNIGAIVFSRNREASLGFMILNPGHADPGYCGALTIKAINLSSKPMSIKIGDPIFCCMFWFLDEPCDKPYSRNVRRRYDREREFNNTHVDRQLIKISDLVDHKMIEDAADGSINKKIDAAIKKTLRSYWLLGVAWFCAPIAATAIIVAYAPEVGLWVRNQIVLLGGAVSITGVLAWVFNTFFNKSK